MQKSNPKKPVRKGQHQRRPGLESEMIPKPVYDYPGLKGSGKLHKKIAVITGGDSGIGRAVSVLFAKEGANISIIYLNEHSDANYTKRVVESYNCSCCLIPANVGNEKSCNRAIRTVIKKYGRIDILVNNAAIHYESKSLENISTKQLLETFQTNIFSMFWLTKAALPYMGRGSAIINSTSVTAYRGSSELIDYASTKGAIVSFTRSLAQNLLKKGIRVNAVAPGPIWTPLIAASFKPAKVAQHGSDAPMMRAGEPVEVAPSYLFLACNDSSYITGQVIHPNGGEIING